MHDVDDRLAFVEAKTPLVFNDIDFTIRDPRWVATALAAPLEYAQRVESVVAARDRVADAATRRTGAEVPGGWTADEVGHGLALAQLMRLLGLTPTPDSEPTIPAHNHLIGVLGRMSSWMHEVVEAVWSTAGAMNEHLAMAAYARMDEMLRERDEWALHETLFRRLRAHESAHKSFYAAYSSDLMVRMRPWQRRLVRIIVHRTYKPVGAGAKRDRPAFARTVDALAGDQWEATLTTPVQQVAERLLNDGHEMDPFVRRAVLNCLATAA